MKILLKNATLYDRHQFTPTDILITDGVIAKIGKELEGPAMVIYDLKGKLVTHNFIDMHTHLRDPGLTYKESVATGTLSALKGGYGTVVAMANTKPVMDDLETLQVFDKKCQEEAQVNTYTYCAITKDLAGEELTDMEALLKDKRVLGFSDDGKGVQKEEIMDRAMARAASLKSIIVAHCEDNRELQPGGCVNEGTYAKRYHLTGINNASEYNEVRRDLKLALKNHCRFHICHISTKESVAALRAAKKESDDVSGEVTPHHLVLSENDIPGTDTNYKMNPPLRSEADHQALIDGLNDGTIKVISTDHAPHAPSEKKKSMTDAAFGIIGLQQAFPVIYTRLVKNGRVKLETVLDALTTGPANVLRLAASVEVGKKADLAIFDLDQEFTIREDEIVSKGHNTPFIGDKVYGKLLMNIVNGEIRVEDFSE